MPTLNLGFKVPDYGKMNPEVAPMPKDDGDRPTKTDYPSLTIPGNMGLAQSLRAGQEFTATVKFRVSEIAIHDKDEEQESDGCISPYGGTRVELDAISMDVQGVAIKEGADEKDGASAINEYFSKKKTKPEPEE